jgi:hypothetical protein
MFISVGDITEADAEELASQASQLANELRELDAVNTAEPVQDVEDRPEGIKGGVVDFSTLLVTLSGASGITAFVTTLGSWLSRDRSRTLKIQVAGQSLELTGVSAKEQEDLVRWFKAQAGKQLAK